MIDYSFLGMKNKCVQVLTLNNLYGSKLLKTDFAETWNDFDFRAAAIAKFADILFCKTGAVVVIVSFVIILGKGWLSVRRVPKTTVTHFHIKITVVVFHR